MGDPTLHDYPTVREATVKILTGDAGPLAQQLAAKIYNDFTSAAQRVMAEPTAPELKGVKETAANLLTGNGSVIAGDLAARGLWEAGQFVTHTAEALKQKLNEPVAPAVMDGKQAASKFVTGNAGEVVTNLGGRALWEVGQFAKHTVESIYGTGAPVATAPTATAPAETTAPKAKAPPPPGSKP